MNTDRQRGQFQQNLDFSLLKIPYSNCQQAADQLTTEQESGQEPSICTAEDKRQRNGLRRICGTAKQGMCKTKAKIILC